MSPEHPPRAAEAGAAAAPEAAPPALPGADDPVAPAKVDWGRRILDNKTWVLAGLGVLLALGLGLWYWRVASQVQAAGPGAAVSAAQLDQLTTAPAPPESAEPQAALDQKLTAEQNPVAEPTASPEALLAPGQPAAPPDPATAAPTPAQRQEYRARMATAAAAANTDTVLATRRDPATGQYTPQRVAQRRVSYGGSGAPARAPQWSAVGPGTNGFAPALAPRPTRDADGTPFETNDEINAMLAQVPEGARLTYERISHRRYRPLLASQQAQVKDQRAALQYVPGMDGFNTVKYRGANAQPDETEYLVPDVFYKCQVQGTQQVRTGSVVMLRLAEEATFGGVTFPRNLTFAALASVESNRVVLQIDRLGPHRVQVEVYNYAYLPGIMIDPGRRVQADGGASLGSALQQSSVSELSNAIAQSQQAANSWQGIAGRMGVTLLGRLPKAGQKLREVTLPDGYPVLLTRTRTTQRGAAGGQPGGAPTGLMGQDGNPLQSVMMQGVGQGGYPSQPTSQNLPPAYYPPPAAARGPR